MRCQYTNQIMLYWSGELSHTRHEEMGQHLKTCATCQETLADLEALEQEFTALPVLKPERDLVRAALEKQEAQEKRWFWWLPVPVIRFAVVLAVVLGLGFWYVRMNLSDPPTRTQERTYIALASRFDGNLTAQMSDLHKRLDRVKKRMRGRERKSRELIAASKTVRTLSGVRSDIQKLKTRIVDSERFLFHNTILRQRRKSYENNTFDRYYYDNHSDWILFSSGVC